MKLLFEKKVGKTIANGQITIPQQFNNVLDRHSFCPIGLSVDVTYKLPNGMPILGKLYQSENNHTVYYQLYIIEPQDRKIFKELIGHYKKVSLEFNLTNRCLILN